MQKYIVLGWVALLLSIYSAQAKKKPIKVAWELLDSVSEHENFQATFEYNYRPAQGEWEPAQAGKMAVQGQAYRLVMDEREVVCNGETVWTYLPEVNEVQITALDPEQPLNTPWAVLKQYREAYQLLSLHENKVEDNLYATIDLLSRDKACTFPKVKLVIERATQHIQCIEALDNNQTLHKFNIANFEYDVSFDTVFFNFSPDEFKNVEVIDLR